MSDAAAHTGYGFVLPEGFDFPESGDDEYEDAQPYEDSAEFSYYQGNLVVLTESVQSFYAWDEPAFLDNFFEKFSYSEDEWIKVLEKEILRLGLADLQIGWHIAVS